MNRRYVLAPEAATDIVKIWRYIKKQSSIQMADRVESDIRNKIIFLAEHPNAGHWRKNLTDQTVKFFSVYSYLLFIGQKPRRYRLFLSCMDAEMLNKSSKADCNSIR